ncbi:hypothetical protein [Streptomyces sp. NBC_01237]|uniref:hypothetical protein n=1 Tax=Streptomyces sp. NBC_01237 TaxID=2903790 RepID=UPI002DD8504A|nr:hypothetical protein [Streptomyces sp. NBC_01237]WRZ75387.1 hypothetical protein OG251_29350 [Streptomyces sp. NBC_01237]
MMPGILAERSTAGQLVNDVDVFGEPEQGTPTRVTVQVRACLSFGELLAMLVFTPGLNLLWEELDEDEAIRYGVQFAALSADLLDLYYLASYVTALYRGDEVLHTERVYPAVEVDYLMAVGRAVTRVFGVTA